MKKYHQSSLINKTHKQKHKTLTPKVDTNCLAHEWSNSIKYRIVAILSNNDCLAKNCQNLNFILSHKQIINQDAQRNITTNSLSAYKSVHSKSKIYDLSHLIFPTDIYKHQLMSYQCYPILNEKVRPFTQFPCSKYSNDRQSLLIIREVLRTIGKELIQSNMVSPTTYLQSDNLYFYKRGAKNPQLQFFLLMKKRQNSHIVLKRSQRSMDLLINYHNKNCLDQSILTEEQVKERLILKKIAIVLSKIMFKKKLISTSQTISLSNYNDFMGDRPFARDIIQKCLNQQANLAQILEFIQELLQSKGLILQRQKKMSRRFSVFRSTMTTSDFTDQKKIKKVHTQNYQKSQSRKSESFSVCNYQKKYNNNNNNKDQDHQTPQTPQYHHQYIQRTKTMQNQRKFLQTYHKPKKHIYYTHQLRRFSAQSAKLVINESTTFIKTNKNLYNSRLTSANQKMRLLSKQNYIRNHDSQQMMHNVSTILKKKQKSQVLRENLEKRIKSSEKEEIKSIFKGKINIEKMNITIQCKNHTQQIQKQNKQQSTNKKLEQQKKVEQNQKQYKKLTNIILQRLMQSRKKLQDMLVFDEKVQRAKLLQEKNQFKQVLSNQQKILDNFMSTYQKIQQSQNSYKETFENRQINKNNQIQSIKNSKIKSDKNSGKNQLQSQLSKSHQNSQKTKKQQIKKSINSKISNQNKPQLQLQPQHKNQNLKQQDQGNIYKFLLNSNNINKQDIQSKPKNTQVSKDNSNSANYTTKNDLKYKNTKQVESPIKKCKDLTKYAKISQQHKQLKPIKQQQELQLNQKLRKNIEIKSQSQDEDIQIIQTINLTATNNHASKQNTSNLITKVTTQLDQKSKDVNVKIQQNLVVPSKAQAGNKQLQQQQKEERFTTLQNDNTRKFSNFSHSNFDQFQEKQTLIETYKQFRQKICKTKNKQQQIINISQIIVSSKAKSNTISNKQSITSSKHNKKSLSKIIDQYLNLVNILGELIVKYIKIKEPFFKANQAWISVSTLAYHRFYVQRKKIQYMIDKGVPKLNRSWDKIKKNQWNKWANSLQREQMNQSIKQANIKIIGSLQKLLKKNKNQSLSKKILVQLQKNLYKYENDFTKQLLIQLDQAYEDFTNPNPNVNNDSQKISEVVWDMKTILLIIAQFDTILQDKELFEIDCLNSLHEENMTNQAVKSLQIQQNTKFKSLWQLIYTRYDF